MTQKTYENTAMKRTYFNSLFAFGWLRLLIYCVVDDLAATIRQACFKTFGDVVAAGVTIGESR